MVQNQCKNGCFWTWETILICNTIYTPLHFREPLLFVRMASTAIRIRTGRQCVVDSARNGPLPAAECDCVHVEVHRAGSTSGTTFGELDFNHIVQSELGFSFCMQSGGFLRFYFSNFISTG